MRNLLDRARTMLNGWGSASTPQAQTYHVVCPQGHPLRGQRTEGYQALRCPACGAGIFVLPRSPLPLPAAPVSAPASRTSARERGRIPLDGDGGRDDLPIALSDPPEMQDVGGFEPTGEIEWVDAPAEPGPDDAATDFSPPVPDRTPRHSPAPKPKRPVAHDGGGRRERGVEAAARPARGDGRGRPAPAERKARPAVARESWRDWARRRRHLLLFLGVALLVVGTVALRVWRSSLQGLPQVAERGRTQGLEALEAGKFDAAHQLLSEASRAVDAMGGAFEGAEEIRQGAREAEIYSNLCPEPLESILAEAGRSDPQEWPSVFDTHYKGRTIIVDAHVTSLPDGAGRPGFGLDYRIFQEGEGGRPMRVGRIDTAGFRHLELIRPKVGDRVQFGARLRSFTFDPDSEEWRVGLEPEGGVEMLHKKALEAFGWPSAEELEGEHAP